MLIHDKVALTTKPSMVLTVFLINNILHNIGSAQISPFRISYGKKLYTGLRKVNINIAGDKYQFCV